MSFLASLAAPAITSGLSFLGSKLFGGKSDTSALQSFQPTGINAGGLTSSYSGGNISVAPTAERLGLVRNLSDTSAALAGEIGGLRPLVNPGFSALRDARLGEIENARSSAIGNLRENLQRRRVLGSSFGADAISRAEAEFAGARDKTASETFLQELEATNNLITQQSAALRQSFQTGLDELNLEADVATKLGAKATETLGANARQLALLSAEEAKGAGKFFGQTFQPAFSAIGKGVGSFFS